MKKRFTLSIIVAASLFAGVLARGGTTVKVINIELAMRAWQERQQTMSSHSSWWSPNKMGIEPGDFPEDGFYGEDLLDKDFCAGLVETLFWEVASGDFITPDSATDAYTTNPFWDEFADFDGITRDNYLPMFLGLVDYINKMKTIEIRDYTLVGSTDGVEPDARLGQAIETFTYDWSYDEALSRVLQRWSSNADFELLRQIPQYRGGPFFPDEWNPWINPTFIRLQQWNRTYGVVDYFGGPTIGHIYQMGLYSSKGRYRYDLRRIHGMGKFYLRRSSSFNFYNEPYGGMFDQYDGGAAIPDEPSEPFSFRATVDGGSIWLSDEYGPTADDGAYHFYTFDGAVFRRNMSWIPRMIVELDFGTFITTPYRDQAACKACVAEGGQCQPGTVENSNGCVDVKISLGNGSTGSMGRLQVFSETPSDQLVTPAGLKLQTNKEVHARGKFEGAVFVPRQIDTPQAFVDIVTLDDFGYEIRFYPASAKDDLDAGGNFAVNGAPFRFVRIDNPDRTTALSRFRVQMFEGDELSDTAVYSWSATGSGWTLAEDKHGTLKNEVRTSVPGPQADQRTEFVVTKDADGNAVSKQKLVYQFFPWNIEEGAVNKEELIEEIADPDGFALRTRYGFYTDTADSENYSRQKYRIDPSGYWEQYEYHSGAVSRKTSPYGSAPFGAPENIRIQDTTHVEYEADTEIETLRLPGGVEHEVGRTYRMLDYNQIRTIRCLTPGAAQDSADNLVSISTVYDQGSAAGEFAGRTYREVNPDGTGALYRYKRNGENIETTVYEGALSAEFTDRYAPYFSGDTSGDVAAITKGTKTFRITNKFNVVIEESRWDIESGLMLSHMVATEFDSFGRATRNDYNDGTSERRAYGCCGLDYLIERSGLRTDYQYDGFGRVTRETRVGVAMKYVYDAAGRRAKTIRIGTDLTEMEMSATSYDSAGRVKSTTEFGMRTTLYGAAFNAAGETIEAITFADGSTSVQTTAMDGTIKSIAGTAVPPRIYAYGCDSSGSFTKETKVGVDGANIEWAENHKDLLGRTTKMVFPDGAKALSFYNNVGQLVRQVDPDGITTLFAYNDRGERDIVAVDVNGNGTIDFDGTDRITKTTSGITTKTVASTTYTVQRNTTQVWDTDGQDTAVTVSLSEQSVDGLRSWQTVRGPSGLNVTNKSAAVLDGNGGRTVTTTGPNGVKAFQTYSAGLLNSSTVVTAADAQLESVTYGYDPHHRLQSTTDARTGTTTYSYYDDDQIHTVITPDPDPTRTGDGYDPQTTTYTFNSAGRVDTVTQPDNTVVNTTYYPTGAVKRTWGSRTYSMEYTYDSQGRVKTLTTWQDFAGDAGKAVTTWNYTPDRGLLLNKRYADNTGPSYTYWPSGRLHTRTWVRTPVVTTTYDYNAAGDLSGITYSDTTPAVAMNYDRLGRPLTRTDAAGLCTWTYDPATGQLKDEDYTSGPLNAIGVHRTFDSLNRLESLSAFSLVSYSYDAASRLDTVTSGTHTATYGYVPNSLLVGTITFKDSGSARLTTTKVYDNLNRLSGISSLPSGSSAVSATYSYNSANQRTQAVREDSSYWGYNYDALGQVTAGKKYLADTTPVSGLDYAWTYDDIGNRKTSTANSQIANYSANNLNQYSSRAVPGIVDVSGAAATTATVTVALDCGTPQPTTRQGELFFKQLTVDNSAAAQNPSLKITGVKNLIGSGGEDVVTEITKTTYLPKTPEDFIYDADGNLTDDARWHYVWDAENRLVALQTQSALATAFPSLNQRLEFIYDGQGRRISKKVFSWSGSTWTLASHTLFIHDGWNLLAELNALNSNAVVSTYVWGLDLSGSAQGAGGVGGILFSNLSTATHASAFDGNGNIVSLINAADGTTAAEYAYGPFGEVIKAAGVAVAANPFGFSTKFADSETGLLYYGHRFYQPSAGRFINHDPIEELGGENLYGFVSNSPVTGIDNTGLAGFFFDGTGNNMRKNKWGGSGNAPTNVAIFFDLENDPHSHYYEGVGTGPELSLAGNVIGTGGQNRLERAMSDLCRDYAAGDRTVDVFGFSRGSAIAREFSNRVAEKFPGLHIRFLGIFDTVSQFGAPDDENINAGIRLSIPDNVEFTAHAIARNEYRVWFPVTSIFDFWDHQDENSGQIVNHTELSPAGMNEYKGFLSPNAIETPFDGAHSDIGGGYQDGRNILALQWMWSLAHAKGVPLRPLKSYPDFARIKNISRPHASRNNWKYRQDYIENSSDSRRIFSP